MEHMTLEENYVQAEGCKVAMHLYEMTADRLQRIVDGLPAFEEGVELVVII